MKNKDRKTKGGLFRDMPRLSPEEETELSEIIHSGDGEESRKAFDKLVLSNVKLVLSIAREFMRKGVEFQDIVSEGMTGLMEGARRFLPSKGAKFSTYASYWIKSRIQRFIPHGKKAVTVPYRISFLKRKIIEYRKVHGKGLPLDEMPEAMLFRMNFIKSIGNNIRILPFEEERFQDFCVYHEKFHDDDRKTVGRILSSNCLTNVEKVILIYRFGLNGNDPMSLDGIARNIGRTKERSRQIENEAIRKLKEHIG